MSDMIGSLLVLNVLSTLVLRVVVALPLHEGAPLTRTSSGPEAVHTLLTSARAQYSVQRPSGPVLNTWARTTSMVLPSRSPVTRVNIAVCLSLARTASGANTSEPPDS